MPQVQPNQKPEEIDPNVLFGQMDQAEEDSGKNAFSKADTVPLPPEQADRSALLDRLAGKIHKYFDETALTKLAYDIGVAPKNEQQEVIRDYAKKIVEEILTYVRCPDVTGALLNLDYPEDPEELEEQIKNLAVEIDGLHEESEEIYALYENLIRRLRKDIVHIVGEELEERGVKKEVAFLDRFYGEGAIGTVHSCRLKDKDIALKLHHFDSKLRYHDYPQLIEATKGCENLVSFYGSLMTQEPKMYGGTEGPMETSRIDFFEELKGAESLKDYLDELNKPDVGSEEFDTDFIKFLETILMPVLKGVKTLHDKGLVHCDIKPDNVLVTEEGGRLNVKLGDYDILCHSGFNPEDDMVRGTPTTMSPEQWNADVITTKSDIFSLGMMLHRLLGGKLPEDFLSLSTMVTMGRIDFTEIKAPPAVKEIVKKCLQRDPEKRPSINELIEQIQILIKEGNEKISMAKEPKKPSVRKAA